jgi:hypothetical protein
MIDLSHLVELYNNGINNMLDPSLGVPKQVRLHFFDTVSNVNDAFSDPIRGDGLVRLPDHKATTSSEIPTVVENTRIIYALIRVNPSDFETYGTVVQDPQSVIRLKTFATNIADLTRCEHIEYPVVDGDSGILAHKYRLVRGIIPIGLRDDKYCVSFWTLAQ